MIFGKIKKFFSKNPLIKEEAGFSLLEVLLSVGVFGAIAVGFVQMSEDYIIEKKAISAAEHMSAIHEAAYENALQNFDAIHTAAGLVGNAFVFDPDGDNDSIDDLVAAGFLPTTFNAVNSYGRDVVVIYRNAGNENLLVTPNISDRLEIIVTTVGNPIDEQQAILVSQNIGGYAGVWSAIDRDVGAGDTTDDFVGVYGVWSTPDAPIQAALTAAAIPFAVPAVGTAHFATYRHVNHSDEVGDYLYRTAVPGLAEANRMRVDIDMNNYNIDGVDNLDINGNLTVRNVASFQGVMGARGDINVGGTFFATGDVTGGQLSNAGGAVMSTDVQNDLTATNVDMSLATNQTTINTQTLNTTRLDTGEFSTQDITVDQMMADDNTGFLATNMDVSNIIANGGGVGDRGRVEAFRIDGAGATTVNVNNSLHSQGVNSTGATLGVGNGRLFIDGPLDVQQLNVTTEFHCDEGC